MINVVIFLRNEFLFGENNMFSILNNKYLAVEGVIGVGKTTLVKKLSRYFSVPYYLEIVEGNPFLAKFYENMEKWAFQTQLFFLLSRFDQANEMKKTFIQGSGVISDYAFYKDYLFAKLNLKGDQFTLYEKVFDILKNQIMKPNLVVYLYADFETIMNRISLRDRSFERKISEEYISSLIAEYENYEKVFSGLDILRIDTSDLDFVKNENHFKYICKRILESI